MIDILSGAIIFAIWSVVLFYGKAIGLSMLLFVVPFTYFLIHILEKRHDDLNKRAKILLFPITLLSITYFIYSNHFFNSVNIIVIPTLVVLMILALFKEKLELKFVAVRKILKIIIAPLIYLGDTFKDLKTSLKENLKKEKNADRNQKIKKVVKALLITIPVVIVIIILLSSADEDFAKIFSGLFESIGNFLAQISFSEILERVILTICAFIYFICFFDYISSRYETREEEEKEPKQKDNFTIKMLLGALNVIYLIFCYIQIKSLIVNRVGINYSYYARQGFFQLMIVSIINLFTMLIAKKREDKIEVRGTKYIKAMSLLMVLFTFIILISAAVRMYAYENAYGYTLLRLLVYCVLFTEAVLLIPTILYILDKNINLPKTYFTIVLSIYICMNFANFDNIIAKRNVDRYIEIEKIDMYYIELGLGTDAINQVARILDMNEDENNTKREAQFYFRDLYEDLDNQHMDFRDVNLSKIFAKQLIKKKNILVNNIIDESQPNSTNENDYNYNSYSNSTSNNQITEEDNSDGIIYTNKKVGYYEKYGECYATTDGGKSFRKILSKEKAANIADVEAKGPQYQYQPWYSEFYSRGKNGKDKISAKLCAGLDDIDRLYHWDEKWKTDQYVGQLMWQIRLFDENDPLTSLYIYIDCNTSEVLGAGSSSD